MRRLFLSSDIEGCPGFAAPEAARPERWAWEWAAARRCMTEDVCAVVEAALANGYDEVIVSDSHGNGHNIEPDLLPFNTRLVRSWPRPLIHMQGIDEPDIAACAFIGYHAGATEQDSVLAHTYSGAAIRSLRVNGELCSEGYFNAALAGEFDLPVILVSGDRQTVADAKLYAPHAQTVEAKQSIGYRAQSALPPKQVREQLRAASIEAFKRPLPAPFKLSPPYVLDLETTSAVPAELLSYLPGVERLDARAIRAVFPDLASAMRFVAFATFYSPTGIAFP